MSEDARESPQTPPAVNGGVGSPTQELFQILSDTTIDLGDVLVSNKHEFSQCLLRNLTDVPLRIEMSSTVGTLGFQHSNENFRGPHDELLRTSPSKTVTAAEKQNFNQVFNYVNLIKHVDVGPNEEGSVVVSYRPTQVSRSPKASIPESFESREVGDVLFQAFTEDGRTQLIKIKFTCRCCLSMLEVQPTELDFGTISNVPNESNTQIQEFTISNSSVIPITFILRLFGDTNALSCLITDYDQNNSVLDTEITLGAHEFRRIQVSVWAKPEAVGDHDLQLKCENLLDQTTHSVIICGTISMKNWPSKPPIEITLPDGTYIDFGNSYAGMPKVKQMAITNVSLHPVNVTFDHDSNDRRDRVKGMISVRVPEISSIKDVPADELCEVTIISGMTVNLEICYTPDLSFDKSRVKSRPSDKLQGVRFRLFVRTTFIQAQDAGSAIADPKKNDVVVTYSKGISCRGMVCTSRVNVREKQIDFGDSVVGATASCHVTIENPTSLPAELTMEYDSKIMKAVAGHVVIKETSVLSLEFQIVPHKVNPSFCKQVFIRNVNNPKDVSMIYLSSNNIDSSVSHSQYYSVTILGGNNKKDSNSGAGTTASGQRNGLTLNIGKGFPILQSFKLRSKHDSVLELSASVSNNDRMHIYRANPGDDEVLELIKPYDNAAYLDLLPKRDPKAERAYVDYVFELQKNLDQLIRGNRLIKVDSLSLAPEQEQICYALCTINSGSKLTGRSKMEEHINVSILNIESVNNVREIPVTLHIDMSDFEIGQKNLNLGEVAAGERRTRTVKLHNPSSLPLLFQVSKDKASLNSGCIRIEGSREQKFVGLVRPFARIQLEVHLTAPSAKGRFHESLTFSNIIDSAVTETMILKADIAKFATFEVKPVTISTGVVHLRDQSLDLMPVRNSKDLVIRRKVMIMNIGKSKKDYLITPSPDTPLQTDKLSISVEFDAEIVASKTMTSKTIEEDIEQMEQKIKILARKKKEEKEAAARKKLTKLKDMLRSGIHQSNEYSDISSSSDDGGFNGGRGDSRKGGGFVTKHIPPNGSISLGVTIHIQRKTVERVEERVFLDIVICEVRDKQSQKTLKIDMDVRDHENDVPAQNPRQQQTPHRDPFLKISTLPGDDNIEFQAKICKSPKINKVPQDTSSSGYLAVLPDKIDFGNVPIGQSALRHINLHAYEGNVGFVILQMKRVGQSSDSTAPSAKIDVAPKTGVISEGKHQQLSLTITPTAGRLQKYILDIKQLKEKKSVVSVTIAICGVEVSPLTVQPSSLDFEELFLSAECPVNRFGSKEPERKILPVSIKYNGLESCTVSLSFTHPAQYAAYRGLVKSEPCQGNELKTLKLEPQSTTIIYACIYPRLEARKVRQGVCRKMEGSLIIRPQSSSKNWRTTVPMTCRIGCVILSVAGPTVMDLGVQRKVVGRPMKIKPVRGSFFLHNLNQEMSLEYAVHIDNDAALRVDNVEGFIPASGVVEISFTLTPSCAGLLQETITFRNRSSRQAPLKRTLIIFVDDSHISCQLPTSSTGGYLLQVPTLAVRKIQLPEKSDISGSGQQSSKDTQHGNLLQSAVTDLSRHQNSNKVQSSPAPSPSVADLVADQSLEYEFCEMLNERSQIVLENKSATDLWLLPKCELHGIDITGEGFIPCISASANPSDFDERVPLTPASCNPNCTRGVIWSAVGPCIEVPKHTKKTVYVQPRCVPDFSSFCLSSKERNKLAYNRVANVYCRLAFFVERASTDNWPRMSGGTLQLSHGKVAQIVKIKLRFCNPQVFFGAPQLLIPKVRPYDKYSFSLEIKNSSQIPVPISVMMPSDVFWEKCCTTPFPTDFKLTALLHPHPQMQRSLKKTGSSPSKALRTSTSPTSYSQTPPSRVLGHLIAVAKDGFSSENCDLLIPSESVALLNCIIIPPADEESCRYLERVFMMCNKLLSGSDAASSYQFKAVIERNTWSFEAQTPAMYTPGFFEGDEPICLSTVLNINAVSQTPASGNAKVDIVCNLPDNSHNLPDASASPDALTATLSLEPIPETESFLTLRLQVLSSNGPLTEKTNVTFTRDEPAVGLRVRVAPTAEQCISKVLAEKLWNSFLEDIQNHYQGEEKGAHLQLEHPAPGWSTAEHHVRYNESDNGSLINYSTALRVRDSKQKDLRPVQVGNLHVESSGIATYTKEIWGIIVQQPTFEVACHESIVVYEHLPKDRRGSDIEADERVFKRSFSVNRNPKTQGIVTLATTSIVRDGYSLMVDITPKQIQLRTEKETTVTVVVTVPQSVTEEQLHNTMLLFLQDIECPVSAQVLNVVFSSPVHDEEAEAFAEEEVHPIHTPSAASKNVATTPIQSKHRNSEICDGDSREGKEETPDDIFMNSTCESVATNSNHATLLADHSGIDSPDIEMDRSSQIDSLTSPISQARERSRVDEYDMSADKRKPQIYQLSSNPPVMKLHNCKPSETVDCRQYSVAFTPGKQDGDPPTSKILVENTSNRTLDINVDIVNVRHERNWLNCSHSALRISPGEVSQVILTASTQWVGSLSTFVVFEIPDLPGELVTMRCAVEILAWGPAASNCFDILVDGKTTTAIRPHTCLLDFGDVFFDEQIVHRCFDVVNTSDMKLEFNVTHSSPTFPDSSPTNDAIVNVELSLALHTLKIFQRLSIEPHQAVRVYVWYQVTSASKQPVEKIDTEVTLKCRMVKDLTKTIILSARCLDPQVSVSADDFSFYSGSDTHQSLHITNLSPTHPAMVEVRGGTLNTFSVTSPSVDLSGQFEIEPGASVSLDVSHDALSIDTLKKQYSKEEFILEEHCTVYNRLFPKEKKYIVLRCFVGISEQRFSGRDVLHTMDVYNRLRDRVFRFTRMIKLFSSMNILPEYEPIEREGESCESDVTSDECDSSDGEGPNESLLSCHISRALGSIPDLYFEFRWLTDELVYYGLRGKRGSYFDMAKLMYYSIFSSWIFRCSAKNCTQVKLWKGQARYFDTYSSIFGAEIGDMTFTHCATGHPLKRKKSEGIQKSLQ